MNNFMKNIAIGIFAIVVIFSLLKSCQRNDRIQQINTIETRTITSSPTTDASSEFDLRVLENALKQTADAQTLEAMLNQDNPALHNLDLDEDGKVDYVKVTEFGSGNERGLSLTVELPPVKGSTESEVQEIATITIEKETDTTGNYQIQGNPSIYGNNYYYRSGFGIGDYLLMSWMFSHRPYYSSPWGYGRYPPRYNSWATASNSHYSNNIRRTTGDSTLSKSNTNTLKNPATSPNANRNATNVKAPLKNPTSAQKNFQARNPSKTVKNGGFGQKGTKSSKSSSSSNSSVRSSSSSRSGSSSGGGK